MFPVQCEELRTNHLTLLLVVTTPYACRFLWRAYYIEDFKWRLRFRFGVAFWRVVLWEVYFKGPNCLWRALRTSVLTIATTCTRAEPHGITREVMGVYFGWQKLRTLNVLFSVTNSNCLLLHTKCKLRFVVVTNTKPLIQRYLSFLVIFWGL